MEWAECQLVRRDSAKEIFLQPGIFLFYEYKTDLQQVLQDALAHQYRILCFLNSNIIQTSPVKNVNISAIGKDIHKPVTPYAGASRRISGSRKIRYFAAERTEAGNPLPMP